jgi:chromosomal replication initiation ATPase DnaA
MLEQPVPAAREAHERMKAINARIAAAAQNVQRQIAERERAQQAVAIQRYLAANKAKAAVRAEYERPVTILREKATEEGVWLVADLLGIAAEAGGVSIIDIRSNRRMNEIVRPRQTFCWLAKQFSYASFPQIGQAIGGKDHTTALYAYLRVESAVRRLGSAPEHTPQSWAEHLLSQPWPRIGRDDVKARR